MPDIRTIITQQNKDKSKFEPEPVDADRNPVPKERDYKGNPAASPPDEKSPIR